jgi:hypothetical protein
VLFKPAQQLIIQQRVEHDAWRFLNLGQNAIELLLRADQRIDMFNRQHFGVLRGRRARNRGQRLAGRVGHEVKVEIAASTLRHGMGRATCEFLGRRPRAEPKRKPTIEQLGQSFHIVSMGTSSMIPHAYRG